jgi:hypothetical protein
MKSRMIFFAAAFVLAAAALAWAADINGKWVAQVPGRGGQTRETTFTFKAEGGKLTGTVSGMQGEAPIADGIIKGDDISFTQTFTPPQGGDAIKVVYKGKISGDEIKFTRAREGGSQPPAEFTAKRAK